MPRDSFMAVPAEAWDRIFGNKEKDQRREEMDLREGCKYDVCDCSHCNPDCDRTEPEDDCD